MKQSGIYFLSIPLPEELLLKIEEWKSTFPSNGLIRWVREEKLHITVLFLGNIENEKLNEIAGKISSVLQNFNTTDLHVNKPEIKKLHNRKKNMLWLRVDNNSEFERLHMELKNNLADYAAFGKGSFNPHITLARHVDKSFRLSPEFKVFEHRFNVQTIELMESDRTGQEVKYVVKERFFLG